ncbi:MAG: hypothetical protein SO064_08130, partial [Prevotella sp.]|nr:hypothetical protein [Prevotella sp.]
FKIRPLSLLSVLSSKTLKRKTLKRKTLKRKTLKRKPASKKPHKQTGQETRADVWRLSSARFLFSSLPSATAGDVV